MMAFCNKKLLVLLTVFINDVISQYLGGNTEYQYGRAIKCKRDDGVSQRCMPVFENIAFDKDIYANDTCGINGQTEYCVQTGTSGAKKICEKCDNSRSDQRHPADLMTDMNLDETPTWWQSGTLLDQRYGAHLILDFKKKYNVAFVRIRFHTIRPHSFAIYKKSTYDRKEKWLPYQFYSRTCQETYNLANKAPVRLSNQKIALCSDEFSGMIPLSGGNVAYLTLYNRPGKKHFDKYVELQEWVTVTALRFNLDRLNTFGDEVFGDPKVLKSYYFAVSDIAVGGRCKCNGHSSQCTRDDNGNYYCVCDHNTGGKDCQKCLPLYNEQPWRRAAGRSANPCRQCDCNGLADECVFDEQLWSDSNSASGGRCINCQKNTAGIHCERCKEYHYRGSRQDACKPCNCNQVGSLALSCSNIGNCACKPGVTGEKCDSCRPGYYGFSSSGCRRCNCNSEGSVNKNCDASGQCKCKDNVIGKQCNKCPSNYFDLDIDNPKGCKACFCYGHGISCTAQSSDGFQGIGKKVISSSFETDFDGWKLQDEYGNDYSKNLQWNVREQYVYIRPIQNKELYFVAPKRYLGNRLTSYSKVFSFLYGVFKQKGDPEPITSRKDIIFESVGYRATYEITDHGNAKPTDRFITFKFRLIEPPGMTTFNFQRLLSNLTAVKVRVTYLPQRRGAIDNIRLDSTQQVSLNSPEQVTWKEKCECKQGYSGTQCELCDTGYTRSAGTRAPYGRCTNCECNNHGTKCHPESGDCKCSDNTTGRNCEICKSGFYGNPTRGNPDDCQPCPCVFANECILIGNRVKCTNCPDGHIGDRCEICDDGYFGDPKGTMGQPKRCKKCECSGNVDKNAFNNCDRLTGECLKCINNTKNGPEKKCEKCADGYYGDALKGQCKACKCFENGTKVSPTHKSGEAIPCDQKGKCVCRKNVFGDRCDSCPAGHWNVASGKGCEKCDCNLIGSNSTDCDIKTGRCKCKEGVNSRTCDQCAAGHYKFSKTGCIACNCNRDGSKHENCTRFGVCECLPGVLGLKCSQCPENKHNLSIGCISCPKCFELIQVAIIELREKMSTFNLTSVSGETGVKIRDKDFEAALKILKDQILALKMRMEKLLKGDDDLFKFFKSLTEQFSKLKKAFSDLERMLEKSTGASKAGQTAVKKAEEIIELIKKLLKESADRLEKEGAKIIKKAKSGSGDVGDLSKQMSKLAEEARKLADKHERESAKIKKTTDVAYNSSSGAYKTAVDAKTREEQVKKALKQFVKDAKEAKLLAEESERLIKQASTSSNVSLTDAKIMIVEAKTPLPDFGVKVTIESSTKIKTTAVDVKDTSETLVTDNKPGIDKLDRDDIEARELMKKGYKFRNESEELYQKAKDANAKSKLAQEQGKRVAREAKEMLKTLESFETKIRLSKANATEAKRLIPMIKKLIKEANQTAQKADENANMSEQDATDSLTIIREGNVTAITTKTVVIDNLAEARKLLAELMRYQITEVEYTKKNITAVYKKIEEYKDQVKKDAVEITKAYNTSLKASSVTAMAQEDLTKALKQVADLLTAIEALDSINLKDLKAAEDALKAVDDKLDGKISIEIINLQNSVKTQENNIKSYELDLSDLRKQVAHTEDLFNYMPKTCFKVKGNIEQ